MRSDPAQPVPALECQGLTVSYGPRTVLRNLDLTVGPGEAMAVLGPSGCGKTTLLYTVAGFVTGQHGRIRIAGQLVADGRGSRPTEDRHVGVVFQNYALWPHLSALDTVAYPMLRAGLRRPEARRRAADLLDRMGVAHLAGRRPAQLSGGEQQRVGVARALARQAPLYLFDEPTAHLDTAMRGQLQEELAVRRSAMGAAVLYATHDVAEAFAVADRVALVRDGAVLQVAPPQEVYERPADLAAARLTGPAFVLELPATIRSGHVEISVAGVRENVPVAAAGPVATGIVRMLVRPEWGQLGGSLPGRVIALRYRGADTDYRLETPVGVVEVRERGAPRVQEGERIGWGISRAWLLPSDQPEAPVEPAIPTSAPDPSAPVGR